MGAGTVLANQVHCEYKHSWSIVSTVFYFCLLFETYMRPWEGLALRCFQLLPPIKGIPGAAGKSSARASWEQPGKTGEYDTRVSLDLARHQFLFSVLQLLKATRGEQQLLFPFFLHARSSPK